MGNIRKTTYKLSNASKQWLLSHDFTYNRLYSDEKTEVYTYRFTVYRYDAFSVLDAEFKIILGENDIRINVYDHNTLNKYAPFYYYEYGNYDKVLEIIDNNIRKQLDKLGVNVKEY